MTGQHYPDAPGHRGINTSILAAAAMEPQLSRLHGAIYRTLHAAGPAGLTGDQIAERLGWERFAVRPRTSEMRAAGTIRDRGRRGRNRNGRSAIIWTLATLAGEQGDA